MQDIRCRGPILTFKLVVINVEITKTTTIFFLKFSLIKGIMIFFIAVIVGSLENIPILAYVFCDGSSISLGIKDSIVFLLVLLRLV